MWLLLKQPTQKEPFHLLDRLNSLKLKWLTEGKEEQGQQYSVLMTQKEPTLVGRLHLSDTPI